MQVVIDFEDAAFGVEKEIQFPRLEDCDVCEGSGAEPGTSPKTCPTCNGRGQVRNVQSTPLGRFETLRTCNRCGGSGRIIEKPCRTCHGQGKVRRNRRVTLRVPAGVDTGSKLRMPGEGEPGINGGPPGDLYVYVQVKPHKVFQRRGFDIYCEIPITFIQAALGDEVEVPVLDGSGSIKVPEGTQTGASFTLKGKGIPHIRGNRRGDQIVFVKVVTPTRLTEKQKELLRKFEQEEEKKHERKGIFNKVKDAFTG